MGGSCATLAPSGAAVSEQRALAVSLREIVRCEGEVLRIDGNVTRKPSTSVEVLMVKMVWRRVDTVWPPVHLVDIITVTMLIGTCTESRIPRQRVTLTIEPE